MKIYIVTRKDYDFKWRGTGLSKEEANINNRAEKISTAGIDRSSAVILTSPFKDDKKPAEMLGNKLSIKKIEECKWLVFTNDLGNNLPDILSHVIGNAYEENIVIVACRAVVATLMGTFKELNIKVKDLGNELYLAKVN